MQNKLWTKDYTLITGTTILSAIGGEAIMFPLSLLVYDETGSPLLSAIILIAGFAPDILFSVLIAPLVEKWNKKTVIIVLDTLLLGVYMAVGVFLHLSSFNYWVMLLFTLSTSTISIVYSLAFQSWLPDIIPEGCEQRGNAIGSTIYPFITMMMAPLSAWAYKAFGIANIFFAVSALLLISIILERQISYTAEVGEPSKQRSVSAAFRAYRQDLIEGIRYYRSVKGLRNIGAYMSITNGCSGGIAQMTQYYFQTHPVLNVVLLGTLKTAQMLGRVIGGALQYRFTIPPDKRFGFTRLVYFLYDSIDTVLLFLPYPVMLGLKFITGGLGTSSAIIRSTAYQNFLPRHMRARVGSINSLLLAVGMALSYLISGMLAEYLPYRAVAVIFGIFQLVMMYLLIARRARENRPIYEADRTVLTPSHPG